MGSFEGEWSKHEELDDWMMTAYEVGGIMDEDDNNDKNDDVAQKNEDGLQKLNDEIMMEYEDIAEENAENYETWLANELVDMNVGRYRERQLVLISQIRHIMRVEHGLRIDGITHLLAGQAVGKIMCTVRHRYGEIRKLQCVHSQQRNAVRLPGVMWTVTVTSARGGGGVHLHLTGVQEDCGGQEITRGDM